MKQVIYDIELAEKFIKGSMNETDRLKVAERIDHDEDFNLLVQDMDRMIDGIRAEGVNTSIEEKIKRLHMYAEPAEIEDKGKLRFLQNPVVRYAAAASVIFAIALITFFVNRQAPYSTAELYAQYFEPFDSPGSGMTRGQVETSEDKLLVLKTIAYEAYDAGRYEEAAKQFESILIQHDEVTIDLCLANAYMVLAESGNHADAHLGAAEKRLIHVLKSHNDLVTQTKWYLALIYVRQNKMERAKATLWEISDASLFGEKAKRLLKDLN